MTIEELLLMPKSMDIQEYEKLLKDKERIKKKIKKLCLDIDFENDSLDALSDEKESDRYKEHFQHREKCKDKLEKEKLKLNDVINKLK